MVSKLESLSLSHSLTNYITCEIEKKKTSKFPPHTQSTFNLILSLSIFLALATPNIPTDINANEILGNVTDKLGVSVAPELVNAIEGFDVNQVTQKLKDKCIQNSGSDAAYEEAEVSWGLIGVAR